MQYQIKRGEAIVATVKPTGKQNKKIMGENLVTMSFDLPVNLRFEIGDYCEVFGETYKLKSLNDLKKSASNAFNYTLTLKGKGYDLDDENYMFPDADNQYTLTGQTLMGDLNTFIDLLITNANREQTGWVKGVIDETDFQNITFNTDDTCLSVLATLATAFDTEWWIDGQTIHMTKKGVVEAMSFKVGKGNGLYFLQRSTSTERDLVTRLYVYGSERNIPADYKGFSNRLKLPGSIPYLQKNVYKNDDPLQGKKYGVIEKTLVFEDVYPRRIGLVTASADKLTFTDSEIDFNVNTQLLAVSAKVQFQTGNLAGYTFELDKFDNATKQFTLKYNTNDKNYTLPTEVLKPAIGDQYILLDIAMPASYITTGENELLSKGEDYLSKYSNPVLIYGVDFDPIDFARKNITLALGNYIPVTDADFDLDQPIRITALTRDLQITSQYACELADNVTIAAIVRNAVANENLKKTVERIGKTSNRAYNDALQAKATADGVKLITDFWGVTIDPDHGIIASGTLLVGSGPVGNAGITGVIDNVDVTDPANPVDRSVRIWAGADYEHKNTASFRVTNDGKMIATAGKIGNWDIDTVGLVNDSVNDVYLKTVKRDGSGNIMAAAYIGTDSILTGDPDSAVARFESLVTGPYPNRALYCRAHGSDLADSNIAGHFDGAMIFQDTSIGILQGAEISTGMANVRFQYKGGSGETRFFEVRNGWIVDEGVGP